MTLVESAGWWIGGCGVWARATGGLPTGKTGEGDDWSGSKPGGWKDVSVCIAALRG